MIYLEKIKGKNFHEEHRTKIIEEGSNKHSLEKKYIRETNL